MKLSIARSAALAALALSAAIAPPACAALPSDPRVAEQEPLRIMRVGEALDRVGRPPADVPVLVADTGLDMQHPDLAPRIYSAAPPLDLIGTDTPGTLAPDSDPDDPIGFSGHGTAVAGVLGAAHGNGEGGAGVAPNARFIAQRSCWDGDQCYQSVQDDAINTAAGQGARVISFSWLSGPLEADLQAAIVNHPEVLFVTIPSGNGGAYDADPENPLPCNLGVSNVLCVSTSAPDDGLDCGAFGPQSVDVAVPTRNNITTINGGTFGATGCATSYAAPAAAGVATILFGLDPAATPADVKAAIMDSARRVPAWAGKSQTGGVVDAAAAVELFQQRRGIEAPKAAAAAPASPARPAAPPAPNAPAPAVAQAGIEGDVTAPGLALAAKRLGGRRVGVRVTLSERAAVAVKVVRRGKVVARVTRTLAAGTTTITLARPRAGSYRVLARATDAAGNRSPEKGATLRIT